MTFVEFFNINHFQMCVYPEGFIIHGIIALIALLLYIWWSKKDALMSFRSWALFMVVVHIVYFFLTCDHIRACIGITMRDIYFLRGVEVLATFITVLRLYFIIEAHGIDISKKANRVNPIKILGDSLKKAITSPEDPKTINGYAKKGKKRQKSLKKRLLEVLF